MKSLEELKMTKSNGNTEIGIKSLFNKLSTKRKKDAEVLLDFEYRGIWETAIKKYSSNAHFVYELLQNADDVKATWVKFELEANGLWFKHNGKNFSISDIDTTESDTHSGKLGDLNAITSIGNSSKIDDQKIGKFGIGFKSVFAYSSTAKIYDNNFSFELVNYIIPIEIEPLSEKLRNDETWFYFPFNRDGISKEKAFSDISQKLKNLEHPILFLPNLKEISWATQAENGTYTKEIKYDEQFDDIKTQRISLVENNGRDIWLFTRNIIQEGKTHKCAVGFFLNERMKLDVSTKHAAFCFFPTKEDTNLKFIIQAPFLLTDNREKLVAGDDWNKILINHLADLAADSILLLKDIGLKAQNPLIDDSLISLIPYKESDFAKLDDKDKISFLPFCTAIKKKLQTEVILPCSGGGYTAKNAAYWASNTTLIKLFDEEQLSALMRKPNCKWVFSSIGRDNVLTEKEDNQSLKANYLDSLVCEHIAPEKLLTKLDASFIEKQSTVWLKELYTYLSDKETYRKIVKKSEIFINDKNKPQAAYNNIGEVILFLPTESESEYDTIHIDFDQHEKSKEFFKNFGINSPTLKDEINNKILRQYMSKVEQSKGDKFYCPDGVKRKTYFKKIFEYYCQIEYWQQYEYINKLKNLLFIDCKQKSKVDTSIISAPDNCYYPSENLVSYFDVNPNTVFINLAFYGDLISTDKKDHFLKFLSDLGVNFFPVILRLPIPNISYEEKRKRGIKEVSNRGSDVYDKNITGIDAFLKNITVEKSLILWGILLDYIKKHGIYAFRTQIQGEHKYFRNVARTEEFNSSAFNRLTESTWIVNKNGEFVSPNEIIIRDISDNYDTESTAAKSLIEFLKIKNQHVELNLDEKQKKALSIGTKALEAGITQEDIDNLVAERKRVALLPKQTGNTNNNGTANENPNDDEQNGDESNNPQRKRNASGDIPKPFLPDASLPAPETEPEEDEYNPMPVIIDPATEKKNFDQIEKKKDDEYQNEKELRLRRAEYMDKAASSEMYTFGWFKALLELEDSFTTEDRVKRNPIRVVFNKAKIEDDGTLSLYDAPYIPPSIEDVGELRVTFYSGNDDENIKPITVEVVSPQKDRVKAKLVKADALTGFDLSIITKAVVEVSNADFILEKLKVAFRQLQYNDDDNLHLLLPQSLNFIFGPPGTGKTTYLAWLIGGLNPQPLTLAGQQIMPLMENVNKVLVLTPTNKASDVLTEKIIENYLENSQYPEWLMRFGETKSEMIMDSNFFIKNKKVDAAIYSKATLITTIARFPYDKFIVERTNKDPDKWPIKNFAWDYIIFDEASMISLASIIYVIYQAIKVNPDVTFIIGGDPFQIHPITQLNWEGWSYILEKAFNPDGAPKLNNEGNQIEYIQDAGNIYSMVGLTKDSSFMNPQTSPHSFPVHNLTKQFRSIEPIGALFSNYRYNGKLLHDRIPENIQTDAKKAVKKLEIFNLPLKPITIIHFPVKRYESLYRSRSIKGSPYQIYSAIFIVELLKYVQKNATISDGIVYKIGVICPFKIQESVINKLIEKTCKGKIEIVTGTVHGFQGDQCDLVVTVFNPPAKITRSTRSFLNKKNILNVAISRAKDCLIILVPENSDGSINIEDLHQIEQIKRLARSLPETKEHTIEYKAEILEQTLFKDDLKIKDFVIPYTHQNVNVYTPSKTKYEVRIDENAIDIKLE